MPKFCDVTNNGQIDIGDAQYIAAYLAGLPGYDIPRPALVDANGNGDIDIGDAQYIAAYLVKLPGYDIPDIDVGLGAGDTVKVGKSVELESLHTPGHTMSHVCLLSHTDQPALICGDTMFNAGAGNCHNGGHPAELYATFTGQISKLPDDTLIYPGHDYITTNLEFTLSREPNNTKAKTLLEGLEATHDPDNAMITTLGEEKEVNTFFRLHNPEIIEKLREEFPELSSKPDSKEVFLLLRAHKSCEELSLLKEPSGSYLCALNQV